MATQEREHSTAHSEGFGSARVNDEGLLLRANGRKHPGEGWQGNVHCLSTLPLTGSVMVVSRR